MIAALLVATTGRNATSQCRVYFIGNSVTDAINYERFARLAEEKSEEVIIGRHTIPGSPLSWTWEHPDGGNWTEEFGPFQQALTTTSWDVLSLQPFDRQLDGGEDSDEVMGANFIREALKGNPGNHLRVLVYARWPRRDSDSSDTFYGRTYIEQWERPYTNPSWDGGNETRDYFQKVREAWKSQFPDLRIDIVPVGEVLARLASKIEQGGIPGIQTIADIYSDQIHFYDDLEIGNIGGYVAALTFFATIFEKSPVGDTTYGLWNIADPALAKTLQEIVWEVVSEQMADKS